MNCHELDTQVTPYLDAELVAEARVDFEAHLSTCTSCRRHVEIERHNVLAVRQALQSGSPAAPQTIQARLSAALDKEVHQHRNRQLRRVAAIAAGVATVMIAGHHQYRTYQRRLYEQDAALRHARHLPLEIQQSPDAIERWFGGKLDHPVSLPRFPQAQAAGARLLQVRDKPAAYIRYDVPRSMGLFVYGDNYDVEVGSEPAVTTTHGYHVVSWREGEVVYQLVTDLNEGEIHQMMPASTPTLNAQPAAFR